MKWQVCAPTQFGISSSELALRCVEGRGRSGRAWRGAAAGAAGTQDGCVYAEGHRLSGSGKPGADQGGAKGQQLALRSARLGQVGTGFAESTQSQGQVAGLLVQIQDLLGHEAMGSPFLGYRGPGGRQPGDGLVVQLARRPDTGGKALLSTRRLHADGRLAQLERIRVCRTVRASFAAWPPS